MNATKRAYLELHFAVILAGLTAILGDLIQLSALVMVWWRVLIASVSLFFLIRFGRALFKLSLNQVLQFMGIGILVGLHWICFFGSVKYANASVSLVCYGSITFFTAILEPIILKQRFKSYELFIGFIIVPCMALIANTLDYSMTLGLIIGLVAAFLASLFTILNKKLIVGLEPMSVTFLEMLSAFLFISLLLPFYFRQIPTAELWPAPSDWKYLLVLGILCTTVGYVIGLRALKHVSAFAANLVYNLEPLYGIILAIVILKENKELSMGFYIGAFIILASIFLYPFARRKFGPNLTTDS